MRHPFWIVNSILLFLTGIIALYLIFSRTSVPEIEEITPSGAVPVQEKITQVNINKIYEHDLFGTFRKELPALPPTQPTIAPFPEPPMAQPIEVPPLVQPKFLEPLDIKLKGILAIHDDPVLNRAIVVDNKTSKEFSFKVGDTFQDAQLIRILSTKVIFLRSNGQQEVLYLRESDAKADPTYALLGGWETVVQKITDDTYALDPIAFGKRIQNLAEFIDLFGLTTVYKNGSSIGIRIGNIKDNSLGAHLGLMNGDMLVAINGIATTTSQNRLAIYNEIVNLKIDDSIVICFERRKEQYSITILLKELMPPQSTEESGGGVVVSPLLEHEKKKILEQKYKFAPTMQEIRRKERQQMFSMGKAL